MKATRASYAASFSISQIPKEHESFVKSQINKLNYISVRENSGLKILYNLGIKKGVHVVDPVFSYHQINGCNLLLYLFITTIFWFMTKKTMQQ